MSKSKQKQHPRTLIYLWSKGSFPCPGVLSRTRSQPVLPSTPHKWWNPLQRGGTTHRLTGLVPTVPPELWRAGLAAHNPHHNPHSVCSALKAWLLSGLPVTRIKPACHSKLVSAFWFTLFISTSSSISYHLLYLSPYLDTIPVLEHPSPAFIPLPIFFRR